MNKSKKILSFAFAVLLLIGILPFSVSAAEVVYGNFSFKTNGTTHEATLVEYNGDSATVKVPDTIYGYTVTKIDEFVFYNHSEIESISLPNTLKSIGFGAFSSCSKLEKIILPVTVTSIGDYTFQNCTSLKEAYVNSAIDTIPFAMFKDCTSLSKVRFNFYTEKISGRAFENCVSLKTLPEAVRITEIGQEAFFNAGLESIKIDDSVTTISNGAFSGCSNLSFVSMTDSVTSIADNAFLNCSENITIQAPKGSYGETFAKENNIKYEEPPIKYGDVDNDYRVTIKDVTYVQKALAFVDDFEILEGTDTFTRADVNGDNVVDVRDGVLIQRYATHNIDIFPVEAK